MFERFTGEARATVVVAQDSARFLGHSYIGTEHLLLGLLRGSDHVAGRVLAGAGITREGVVAFLERIDRQRNEPEPDLLDKDTAALRTIGIDLDAVRAAVEESFGPGALEGAAAHGAGAADQRSWWQRRSRHAPHGGGAPRGHIPFTPQSKKVLELSLREALALKHGYIGTEHLLLGLIRERHNLAIRILRDEGAQIEQLRENVLAELQRTG